jgi:hypothetical protein
MLAITRILGLATLMATALRADTLEVIDITGKRHQTIDTTYLYEHNGSMRLQGTSNFRPRVMFIWNEPRECLYELNQYTREYKKYPTRDLISYVARLIALPHVRKSGKTVDIYYQNTDTGQRRQILGQTARYLRVTERTVAQPGACAQPSEKDDSGWYIPTGNWKPITMRMMADRYQQLPGINQYTADDSHICEDTVIKHGAPLSGQLLVFQETRTQIIEVTTLSSAPLDDNLFEPPGNYKRVQRFPFEEPQPWLDFLAFKCSQLEDAIATWF